MTENNCCEIVKRNVIEIIESCYNQVIPVSNGYILEKVLEYCKNE